jgi:hypothetical protein
MVGMALTAPPGLTAFAGARPKPSPVVRLFSTLVPRERIEIHIDTGQQNLLHKDTIVSAYKPTRCINEAPEQEKETDLVGVTLESLAWGRSGDKGSKANIGIIARHPDFVPYIATQFSEQRVAAYFNHFLEPGQQRPVERFFLPGCNGFNFLLHDVLGGGGIASLRTDAQGKGYAQLLLAESVQVPRSMATQFNLQTLDE